MLQNSISNNLKKIIPRIENESISWDKQTIIEVLFFSITDWIKQKLRLLTKLMDNEFPPLISQFPALEILTNFFIILIVIALISLSFIALPIYYTPISFFSAPYSSLTNTVIMEFIFIFCSCSITWTGYVYLLQEYRNLVRSKVYPMFEKSTNPIINKKLQQIVSGSLIKWESGFNLRVFPFTICSLFFTLLYISPIINTIWNEGQTILFANNTLFYVFLAGLVYILVNGLVFFLIFMILSIIVLGIFIFLTLINLGIDPVFEISPLIEMGGTEIFGDVLLHTLYIIAFVIAIFPIISIMPLLEEKISQLPQTEIQSIENITTISSNFFNSIKETQFSVITQFSAFLDIFIIFLFLSVLIIVIIHFQIKRRKRNELTKLNTEIAQLSTDLKNNKKLVHLCFLRDQISKLYEWPISSSNFVLWLIYSILLIIISHIFT